MTKDECAKIIKECDDSMAQLTAQYNMVIGRKSLAEQMLADEIKKEEEAAKLPADDCSE